ncbi:MAG: RNA polymerase sigma factor [Cellulosilyticaceae bacterium]
MDDQTLLMGISKGDEASYLELVQKYSRYVAAVCIRVAKGQLQKEDVEEISADVFVKVWELGIRIQPIDGSIKHYLGVMARNHTINKLRVEGKQLTLHLEDDSVGDTESSVEDGLVAKEEQTLIKEAIEEMGEPDGEIFIRRYFYLDKTKDIAKAMGMKESTITTKLSRGKKRLGALLKQKGVIRDEKDRRHDEEAATGVARRC